MQGVAPFPNAPRLFQAVTFPPPPLSGFLRRRSKPWWGAPQGAYKGPPADVGLTQFPRQVVKAGPLSVEKEVGVGPPQGAHLGRPPVFVRVDGRVGEVAAMGRGAVGEASVVTGGLVVFLLVLFRLPLTTLHPIHGEDVSFLSPSCFRAHLEMVPCVGNLWAPFFG